MPNQTKLGFQHQKPGTRRLVSRKPAAEETKNVEATEKPTQPDTAVLLSSRQTMEDKLQAFIQKKKEAQEDAKRPQRPTTRSTGGVKRKITQPRDEPTNVLSTDKASILTLMTANEKSRPLTPKASEEDMEKTRKAEDVDEQEEKEQEAGELTRSLDAPATKAQEETLDAERSTVRTTRTRGHTTLEPHLATPPASSPIEPPPEEEEQEEKDDDEDIHIVARKSVRARPLYIAEEAPDASTASKMTTTVPTTRPRSARSAALQARLSRVSATFSTASQGNLDDIQGSSTSAIPTVTTTTTTTTTSSSLFSGGVSTVGLLLPKSLETLFKLFRGLDHIVRFHQHQGQLCFYHKVQRQVERVASQNFEIRHLAQIKTLYPEAFEFSVAPCLHEGKRIRSYLIELKTEEAAKEEEATSVAVKGGGRGGGDTDDKEGENASTTTNTRFIPLENQRRDVFRERLVQYVRKHHQAFLLSTVPPRTDPFPLSWHIKFDLESVPEVNRAQLPELHPRVIASDPNFELQSLGTKASLSRSTTANPPLPSSSSSSSSSFLPCPEPQPEGKPGSSSSSSSSISVLQKKSKVPHGPEPASTLSDSSTVVAEAAAATAGEASSGFGPTIDSSTTANVSGVGAKEGLASTTEKDDMIPVPKLLSRLEQMKEKIRQKQLQKQLATQSQASKADKTLALQRSRLPAIFDMIRFLRFKVIAVQSLAEKIAYSHKLPLSELEARQHLQLLAQELPEWCQIFAVGGGGGGSTNTSTSTSTSSAAGDHFKVLVSDPVKEKEYRSRLVQLSLTSAS
ncbi:replication licensing factor Cdt1 [Actinomortierella ambigua]|nr:replication licensing factor Cdt1 [Actinomortierella ambigua]